MRICHHLQISELEGGGGLLQYEGGLLEVEGGLLLALGGHHLGPGLAGRLGLGGHSALQLHRNSHILKTEAWIKLKVWWHAATLFVPLIVFLHYMVANGYTVYMMKIVGDDLYWRLAWNRWFTGHCNSEFA